MGCAREGDGARSGRVWGFLSATENVFELEGVMATQRPLCYIPLNCSLKLVNFVLCEFPLNN